MNTIRRAYIGLGANLGDARSTLRTVLEQLRQTAGILHCLSSHFYRTAPVDATGPDYINAVAALDTTLAPLELLDVLQALENQHGRQRPYKNAPRTLDLDLLLYGDTTMNTPRLTLPHPRMHERAFVLAPLSELAPTLKLTQGSAMELLAMLTDQPIERLN
ncbi:2-amino-4-hydroxy-6-hydroxymethyldihydropteridine diphosphokinase [Bordetella genomosp. 4]|uniref:2-amino-4-hydroxy-6-hydroxymethyldihydropteridine pyrophosphokinase n=1 Tax=Bordetella genomosp. 4 TaxID=463044 RepID=A0A261TL40_9BORD|nr:2-amino-4-hydroxy-6-hydroxymethyldihydropteridine diphosphokinase [Bordetella genomosp. 4]